MAFGPVGKIRANCMKNIRRNSSFSTYKPFAFSTVKVKKTSTTPKIKWKQASCEIQGEYNKFPLEFTKNSFGGIA